MTKTRSNNPIFKYCLPSALQYMKQIYLLLFIFSSISALTQINTKANFIPVEDPEAQVSQFIRRMFQDKTGKIWFGTNGDGVACLENGKLTYHLNKLAIRGIVEDEQGNIWFATSGGVYKYDGNRVEAIERGEKIPASEQQDLKIENLKMVKSFTHYSVKDGLANMQVWSILKDKSGDLWFGTEGGVSHFNHKAFSTFKVPAADLTNFPNAYQCSVLINCIFQDKDGNIWFGSNGNGAYMYNGKELVNFSEKDGLCNNFVQTIIQDKTGKLWFGTRFGGASSYENKKFTNYPFVYDTPRGLEDNFIWIIYEEQNGLIWFSATAGGLFRFDGKDFKKFTEKDGLTNKFVQSIMQDKSSKLWIGSSGGLFRFDPSRENHPCNINTCKHDLKSEQDLLEHNKEVAKTFVNIKRNGPWE